MKKYLLLATACVVGGVSTWTFASLRNGSRGVDNPGSLAGAADSPTPRGSEPSRTALRAVFFTREAPAVDPSPAAPKVAPVVAAIEQIYARGADRVDAVVATLRTSGAADTALAAEGYAMDKLLVAQGLVSSDWACYAGGCYFHLTRDVDPDALVAVREQSAAGHVLAITPDAIPDKLVILINDPQEEHAVTANVSK